MENGEEVSVASLVPSDQNSTDDGVDVNETVQVVPAVTVSPLLIDELTVGAGVEAGGGGGGGAGAGGVPVTVTVATTPFVP